MTKKQKEAAVEEVEAVAPKVETEEAAPAPQVLSLQDLNSMLNIIVVMNKRGAFNVEEMDIVGALYKRVHAVLMASLPPAPVAEESASEEEPSKAEEQ